MNTMVAFDQQEAEAILDNLCQLYKAELKKTSGLKIGKEKNRNAQPRFSFIPMAKKIFDPIPHSKIPSLYLALFESVPKYLSVHGNDIFENGSGAIVPFSVEELLLNVIIPYQLPHSVKAPCSQSADASSVKKRNSKAVHYIQTPARVRLDIEHSIQLIRHFLPIKLPLETKVWKQIRYILVPSNNQEKLRLLIPEITAAYARGTISFAALTFLMRDDVLSEFTEEPDAVLHALYLGPLGAGTVEAFASGRSEEFRKKCRAVLSEAEVAMKSPEEFRARKPQNISDDNPELCSYSDFRRNTQILMRDLKGESRTDATIPMGWACAALKKFAKKTYVEKTWKEENLYELIWTIMCQRPNLKKFICDLLEKDFHDYGAARYWRRMQPALMHRTIVQNRATILQLSLRDRIFIIDLDNRAELPASALREFFAILFLDKSILKLGFQFNEDLVQMRAAVPHCRALFEPENVICVGKLFAELLERTEKLKNCDEILNEVLPPVVNCEEKEQPETIEEEEVENIVDSIPPQPKSPQGESILQRTVNRGLSYVCERVLGRPLDKTEQCSLRYAAMDAYCLLLIYDVCCRWAQHLDVSIEEILSRQDPIRVSPPLLSEEF
ncbi:hypothetical protein GCK32_006533 [Trichostrongylus colubriformis]|uniref:Uncharacterized protein n=1 Tax=Trichostrongylus colubriformis TaxID=6319 RepID=A0AAN8FVQ4_TRICO